MIRGIFVAIVPHKANLCAVRRGDNMSAGSPPSMKTEQERKLEEESEKYFGSSSCSSHFRRSSNRLWRAGNGAAVAAGAIGYVLPGATPHEVGDAGFATSRLIGQRPLPGKPNPLIVASTHQEKPYRPFFTPHTHLSLARHHQCQKGKRHGGQPD